MKKIDLNKGWWLEYGDLKRKVDLPFDFTILCDRTAEAVGGGANGWYPGGSASYEKMFYIPEESFGNTFILQVEACYGLCEVLVNASTVGFHRYGYTEFLIDITPYIRKGNNIVTIIADNTIQPNTRWYSGSGLYRGVNLLEGGKSYIKPYGIYVKAKGDSVSITVDAVNAEKCKVEISDGHNTLNKEILCGKAQEIQVKNAKRWSPESPFLYSLKVSVGEDCEEIKLGLKDIELSTDKGMLLNGNTIKLKGACIHHDNGILGANAFKEAEWRKVALLKQHGYNAIRCTHNPYSRHFLDACDSLGMLVIEEAFDCWRIKKNKYDYHMFFETDWRNDAESMLMRDRNRTCIFMWSIGNEIIEEDGRSQASKTSHELAEYFRTIDDRPLTTAIFDLPVGDMLDLIAVMTDKIEAGEIDTFSQLTPELYYEILAKNQNGKNYYKAREKFLKPLDVAGFNYLLHYYDDFLELAPDRLWISSESFALQAYENLKYVKENTNIIGEFIWTAIDYIGEAGLGQVVYTEDGGEGSDNSNIRLATFPHYLASCGDISITGETLAPGAYRDVLYGEKNPSIWTLSPENTKLKPIMSGWGWDDLARTWTYVKEGEEVKVEVYSNADEVELFLNGKSLGIKKPEKIKAVWQVKYVKGTLSVVNIRNGRNAEKDELHTAGELNEIFVVKEDNVCADADIDYYKITALDKDGNLVWYDGELLAKSEGLLATGNDDPKSLHNHSKNTFTLYRGCGQVVVKHNCKLEIKKL